MFLSLRPSSRVLPGILLLSLLSRVHSQSDPGGSFSVDTPLSVGQCETTKLTWNGGQAPFTLDVVFQGNGSLFQDFESLSGPPLSWEATVPAGTVLVLNLYSPDGIGGDYVRLSNPFTVQPGSDSCLGSVTHGFNTDTAVAIGSSHTTTTRGSSSSQRSATRSSSQPAQLSTPSSQTSPVAASAASAGQSGLSTSAIAGIVVGVGVVALCLLLALCLCIRRRRRRAPMSFSDPFIAGALRLSLGPSGRGPGVSTSTAYAGTSFSGVDRQREMSALQTPETNSSLVSQASSVSSGARGHRARHDQAGREDVNGVAVAAKLPFGHGVDGEQHWVPRHEIDAGVRLAGGRVGEVLVADDFAPQDSMVTLVGDSLPPPYSAHFEEL